MFNDKVIAITGAAGFIGSQMAEFLNSSGFSNLVLVDDFAKKEKIENHKDLIFSCKVHRDQFENWLKTHPKKVSFIIHLGARTDTTEKNYEILKELNLDYTKWIWEYCSENKIPLIYASSAATYGDGAFGYKADHRLPGKLKPLNPYGISKNEFDIWALDQKHEPPFWAGLKFFNVYGPNENHKGRMASVIFHAYQQILSKKTVNLFRSHHPDYEDGAQQRDFIYVKDVIKVIHWMMTHKIKSGLYNLGSGNARTFNDLVKAVFHTLNLPVKIKYIDTPSDIREKYQYFTEADMKKLRNQGYSEPFFSLEEGVEDYINNYLSADKS